MPVVGQRRALRRPLRPPARSQGKKAACEAAAGQGPAPQGPGTLRLRRVKQIVAAAGASGCSPCVTGRQWIERRLPALASAILAAASHQFRPLRMLQVLRPFFRRGSHPISEGLASPLARAPAGRTEIQISKSPVDAMLRADAANRSRVPGVQNHRILQRFLARKKLELTPEVYHAHASGRVHLDRQVAGAGRVSFFQSKVTGGPVKDQCECTMAHSPPRHW